MKSVLFARNTANQTNTTINFGSVVRQYGCNVGLSGGNVVVTGAGYYDIDVNVTFTAGADGVTSITIYNDGVLVNNAIISVDGGSAYNITIPATIKNSCCKDSTVTVVVSGATATVNIASIRAERV